MNIRRRRLFLLTALAILSVGTRDAYAMHIADGILPAGWSLLWWSFAIPFLAYGIKRIKSESALNRRFKPLAGLVGAAVFIISCLPVPVPFAGVTSHPTGIGIAAIIVGPAVAVVMASIALTLQALFLAHGGIATLGANIFSMGVVGGFFGYGIFIVLRRLGLSLFISAFFAGLIADWSTYAATSGILSAGLYEQGRFWQMFGTIVAAFSPTQLPLGILEGFLTASAIKFLKDRLPGLSFGSMKGGAA
jgi:cobalt/nickel transport system permease protein